MQLFTMQDCHMKAMYDVCTEAEPFKSGMSLADFETIMKQREGFVLVHQNKVIGVISFSDYVPGVNIIIHTCILPKYQKRWVNRGILKTIGDYVFGDLDLVRMSTISFSGITDSVGPFLEKIGFVLEGCIRKGARVGNDLVNINLYGLLKEDCKWL